jgi:hypothetical protein
VGSLLLAQLQQQLCQPPPPQPVAPHVEHVAGHHLEHCSKEAEEDGVTRAVDNTATDSALLRSEMAANMTECDLHWYNRSRLLSEHARQDVRWVNVSSQGAFLSSPKPYARQACMLQMFLLSARALTCTWLLPALHSSEHLLLRAKRSTLQLLGTSCGGSTTSSHRTRNSHTLLSSQASSRAKRLRDALRGPLAFCAASELT